MAGRSRQAFNRRRLLSGSCESETLLRQGILGASSGAAEASNARRRRVPALGPDVGFALAPAWTEALLEKTVRTDGHESSPEIRWVLGHEELVVSCIVTETAPVSDASAHSRIHASRQPCDEARTEFEKHQDDHSRLYRSNAALRCLVASPVVRAPSDRREGTES